MGRGVHCDRGPGLRVRRRHAPRVGHRLGAERVFRGHELYVYDVAFNAEGTVVASAAWDHTVRLWDAPPAGNSDVRWCMSVRLSLRWRLAPTAGRSRWLHATTRSTSGTWPAANACMCFLVPQVSGSAIAGWPSIPPAPCWPGGRDGRARLWNVATGEPAGVLQGQEARIGDLAFSPDGHHLAAAGTSGAVQLWDLATRQSAGELPGPTGREARVVYSHDGSLIAWVTTDDTVRVAETRTLRELASLYNGTTVYTVAFSPDGTRLAVGCKDNTIRLWDLKSYQQVAELRGHTDYVHAVAFSPDGTQLVSGSGDSTVPIWDTMPRNERVRSANSPAGARDTVDRTNP